ncbi:cache domain-containing protein [Acidaminobacter sp. JC074]|uniref:sensor histidine kinase n=1 Tax=Acidaminobacter sp. JC074 TaxID=2530199 RepID=UPI001F110CBC|nr:cache domain-containing protein [Acidaminobacter sp. JC074]
MRKLRLSERITIIISLTLVVILSLTGVFLYDFISEITRDNVEEASSMQASNISKDITNIFENAKLATEYLSLHNSVQMYLKTTKQREDIFTNQYTQSVYKALEDVINLNDRHFLAWVANEEANFYIDSLGYYSGEDYDVKKRPWYDVANNAAGVGLTTPYVEWETREVVISSIMALYDEGKIYGYVAIDIVLEDVPEILDMMKQGDEDFSYLITGDGSYVYHPNEAMIINRGIYDKDDELYDYKDHIIRGDGSLLEINLDDRDYYLVSHKVDERDWKIVTLIDKTRLDVLITRRSILPMFILFSAMIIAVFMIYVQIRVTTKPFVHLVEVGSDIAAGDFTKNVPERYLLRSDEMGDLSKAFQSITDTFRSVNTRLEEEIEKKNLELESQYKLLLEQEKQISLGYMVTGVAHEINTPLGSCLSLATYLEKNLNEIKEKAATGTMTRSDFERIIKTSEESMGLLIEGLTDANTIVSNFKMISMDASKESKHKFRLVDVFSALIISMKSEIKDHKVMIKCQEEIFINSYPSALSNVFSHLIINSVKHGFKDKDGQIIIDVESNDNFIEIHYRDNGLGMSKEIIDKMYDLFYTTKRNSGSGGLGMYIVFTTVTQKLGGSIEYVGSIESGVYYLIKIPIK